MAEVAINLRETARVVALQVAPIRRIRLVERINLGLVGISIPLAQAAVLSVICVRSAE